jgi:PAS domain S-box-containing protein
LIFRKTIVSFKLILGILFALLVSGIAILGFVSYKNNKNSLETAYLLQKTHQVLNQADEISSLFKDILLESNAFYIRRDSAVILPYLKSRREVTVRTAELRHSIRGNSRQELNVDSLQLLLKSMAEFTDEGLNYHQDHTIAELDERIVMSFHFREQIRRIVGAIKREEQRLMVQRQRDYDSSIEAFRMTYVLLLAVIGLLIAATFFSIRYNFNKRIKAQEEQKKAKELFERIFYESPMGIVISRLDSGEIIDCNRSYTELVKYDKSEVIGNSAVQLGIVGTSERIQLTEIVRDNGVARDIEIQMKPKDADPIWVSKSTQAIVIDDEVCLLSAILDMTVHKEAEEKMKQALASEIELNKLKSNFVTLASHEFRTPLTTALSSATLAEKYATGENKTKISRHVSRIKASVNLLVSILDEFLSLTKIEEKKIEPKIEEMNLRETIEDQCANLKMFAKPGQDIVYNHIGVEQINSDPVLLKSILNNLVSNAIKYSGDNNQILVSSSVNSEIKLTVRDFGIGISPEDQTHLFERFFRASNTGAVQGTGLGLHIMKNYIDMLHGSINVKSEPGKGSEFEVTFHHVDLDQTV